MSWPTQRAHRPDHVPESVKLAERAADREQRMRDALDDASPVEVVGIKWYSSNGEVSPEYAEWSANWQELLSDIAGEDWSIQSLVHRSLGAMRHEPEDGAPVDGILAAALCAYFENYIIEALEEAAL